MNASFPGIADNRSDIAPEASRIESATATNDMNPHETCRGCFPTNLKEQAMKPDPESVTPTRKKWIAVCGSLLLVLLGTAWSDVWAGPVGPNGDKRKWETVSGRGVLLVGQHSTAVQLAVPNCPASTEFLVLHMHVGPEVNIGATMFDVVNLGRWAASVPVYQRHTGGAVHVAFTALAKGPEHVSATLPAGQSVAGLGRTIPVEIRLLGGPPVATASHRFEFNVHLTGACGDAFIHP